MFSIWAQHKAAKAAQRQHEYQMRLQSEMVESAHRRMRLMGRTFKCGPWHWKIVPRVVSGTGEALTPEIKAVWL